MTHAQVIEAFRKDQGKLSLRQYAQKLGVSPAYLSDVYRGNRQAGRKILRAIGMTKTVTIAVDYHKDGRKK